MNPKQTLFIDIETFRSSIPPSRDEIKVPGNYSKPESIQKYIDENLEEEWNKTALNSLKGQIICIGYAIDDEPVQVISGTEQEIISKLEEVVLQNSFLDWVGHNILGFDLPYIYHRAIKFGNKKLRTVIPKGRYPKGVFDTMVEFAGSDYSKRYSLKDICNFLGIDNGKDEIDGSMVGGLWLAGEKDKVLEYCKKDVEILRKVYYRIER